MTEATPSRTRTRSATKAESMDEQKTDGKLGAGEQKPDDKPAAKPDGKPRAGSTGEQKADDKPGTAGEPKADAKPSAAGEPAADDKPSHADDKRAWEALWVERLVAGEPAPIVETNADNPKNDAGDAKQRYDAYRRATTVAELHALNPSAAHALKDVQHDMTARRSTHSLRPFFVLDTTNCGADGGEAWRRRLAAVAAHESPAARAMLARAPRTSSS